MEGEKNGKVEFTVYIFWYLPGTFPRTNNWVTTGYRDTVTDRWREEHNLPLHIKLCHNRAFPPKKQKKIILVLGREPSNQILP